MIISLNYLIRFNLSNQKNATFLHRFGMLLRVPNAHTLSGSELADRITAEFNVLLIHIFVPVAEVRIFILFLAKRGVQDSNLGIAFRRSSS